MKLDIHCQKHPKYTAKQMPKCNRLTGKQCEACLILYFLSTTVNGSRKIGVGIVGLSESGVGILVGK